MDEIKIIGLVCVFGILIAIGMKSIQDGREQPVNFRTLWLPPELKAVIDGDVH